MNIPQAIIHLFPQANPMLDFIVQDDSDGNGAYIAHWNLKDAQGNPVTQPTTSELQATWDAMQPTTVQLLTQYKQDKIDFLLGLHEQQLTAGFTSVISATPTNFSYDKSAQDRFTKQTALLGVNPAITQIPWMVKNQGGIMLTRDQYLGVIADASKHESDLTFKLLYAEANIHNAIDQASVDAIVNSW